MNEKLLEYIKRSIERGYDIEKVKQALINAGHDIAIVEEHASHVIENQLIKAKKRKYLLITVIALVAIILVAAGFYYFPAKKTNFTINESKEAEINYQKNLDTFNKALISNDTAVCNQIADNKLKEECKSKFEGNATSLVDENFKDKEQLNKALINHNISLCAEIKEINTRFQCEQILT